MANLDEIFSWNPGEEFEPTSPVLTINGVNYRFARLSAGQWLELRDSWERYRDKRRISDNGFMMWALAYSMCGDDNRRVAEVGDKGATDFPKLEKLFTRIGQEEPAKVREWFEVFSEHNAVDPEKKAHSAPE